MYSQYKIKKINTLDEINVNINNKNQLIFNKNKFLYSSDINNNQLIVFFHGAIWEGLKPPIFRGYQYNIIPNVDILCLSDILLEEHEDKNLLLGWFLSTEKEDLYKTYTIIISKILEKKYNKVLFTGASGGGYPAIKFSSYFKKSCLIQNSQIYLKEYLYFNKLKKIVTDVKYININTFIKNNGPPKKIILCQNQLDTHHYEKHALPFEKFIKENYSNILYTWYFKIKPPDGSSKLKPHHFNIPNNIRYYQLLQIVLKYI